MIEFPVYPIPKYDRKYEKDGTVYIETRCHRFIFDIPSLEGDYFERREKMVTMDLPYPIYPLKGKCLNPAHLKVSGTNIFVGKSGNLFKYKHTNRVPLQNVAVHNYSISEQGNHILHTDLGDISAKHPYNYIQVFEYKNKYYVLNFSYTPSKKKYIML